MPLRRLPNLPKDRIEKLLSFERRLGVKVKDLVLLDQSLTHSSYVRYCGREGIVSNERLEFVGDAVISMVISEYLYSRYPNFDEGTLSSVRSDVISRRVMYDVGVKLGIGECILIFPPIDRFDERGKRNVISNCLEAVIGAVFLSNGFEVARKVTLELFVPAVEDRVKNGTTNYKSVLQSYVVRNFDTYPEYSVIEERGPDHRKEFFVSVSVGDVKVAEGRGFSKKEAEQSAAKKALELLKRGDVDIGANSKPFSPDCL